MTWSEAEFVACLGCKLLPKCKKVTAKMIAEDQSCTLFDPVDVSVRIAREQVLDEYGPHALLPTTNPRIKKSEEHMSPPRRTTLRQIAIELELVKKDDANTFSISSADLLDIISEQYEDAADWDNEEALRVLAELKEGGGADDSGDEEEEKPAKKTRGRAASKKSTSRRGRRKAAEPEESEDDPKDEKEEAPKKTPRRGRGRRKTAEKSDESADKKPSRRGRGRRTTKKAEEPEKAEEKAVEDETVTAEVSLDLGPVLERLDVIGPAVDELTASAKSTKSDVASLKKSLAGVEALLAGIDAALVEMFNEGLDEEDHIESCIELVDEGK